MLREEYVRRLVDAAHIELYLSANDGARLYWPWRMHPPKEASSTYRNACEKYAIDSDPKDDSVTTTDVLDTAFKLDAEIASLQDVYQDKDATVDTLLEGLAIADSHPYDGELILPLQAPFGECYKEIGEPKNHILGIGGLKDSPVSDKLAACEELRGVAGYDVQIHGFGWGDRENNGFVSDRLAPAIRDNPGLLDSIDYSTPVQSNAATTASAGDEVSSITAMKAGAKLIRDLREVGSYVDTTPDALRGEEQSGMENWHDTA